MVNLKTDMKVASDPIPYGSPCRHTDLSARTIALEACLPMEDRFLSVAGWHRGGLQCGPPEDFRRLASSDSTILSPEPNLFFRILYLICSGLQKPIQCHHPASSSGTGSASSLEPLNGYRRQASSVASPFIATTGPLERCW